MIIRRAAQRDCSAIAAIWNPILRDTMITFNPVEKTEADIARLLAEKEDGRWGVFVADEDETILGFATYGQFRGGLGYQFTAEHTVILDQAARGRGVGRRLMETLEAHARARGIHSMFAGVSSENGTGIGFHQAIGYEIVAVLPEVGFKFDRWLDLTLMQKRLDQTDSAALVS